MSSEIRQSLIGMTANQKQTKNQQQQTNKNDRTCIDTKITFLFQNRELGSIGSQ